MTIEIILLVLLGIASGAFLTFMDRVDEHDLVIGRWKHPLAYLFAMLTSGVMIYSMEQFVFLYPFLFGMCVEWIWKNKLEFPSHVFFLFCTTLYFGYRADLLLLYYPYILIYFILSYCVGSYLREKVKVHLQKYLVFYNSYGSKVFVTSLLALFLGQLTLVAFGISFAYSCLFVKRKFPGRKP